MILWSNKLPACENAGVDRNRFSSTHVTSCMIRIVWGTGTGPTRLAAYDAALADANLHEYNLVELSSVIPAGATIEPQGVAPELGSIGDRLYVVEASATTADGPASAGIGWARRPDGSGIFYEAGDEAPPETVSDRLQRGLAAGTELREGTFGEPSMQLTTIDVDGTGEGYGCAAVLAAVGNAEPL